MKKQPESPGSSPRRPRHPMPPFVKRALDEAGLVPAYRERPAYQRNDYLGWIARAKRPETREKRLGQMLRELVVGGMYMNMAHPPSRKGAKGARASLVAPAKRALETLPLLDVATRKEWRAWLRKHYRSEREIWLVFHKKHTGRPRIPYNDAVEEALCFGWIDSTARRLDDDRYAQRFSVRNPKTPYSQTNKERLRALLAQGKVAKEVAATLGDLATEQFTVPPDILDAIKADRRAWRNFRGFSEPYVRIRVAFIDGARKRPAEFAKRLRHFVAMAAENRQFGFGGVEKYS